jgi:hypothetical protein
MDTSYGSQLFKAGGYLTTIMDAIEIVIMAFYMRSFWRSALPEPWKDADVVKLGVMLMAGIVYVVLLGAACLTTQLRGLPHAHAVVSLGFALKLWIEFAILLRIIEFSGRVQRASCMLMNDERMENGEVSDFAGTSKDTGEWLCIQGAGIWDLRVWQPSGHPRLLARVHPHNVPCRHRDSSISQSHSCK